MTLGELMEKTKQLDILTGELKRIEGAMKAYEAGYQAPDPNDVVQAKQLREQIQALKDLVV